MEPQGTCSTARGTARARRPMDRVPLGLALFVVASTGCSASVEATPTLRIQGIARAAQGAAVADVEVCLRPDPMSTDNETCTTSDPGGAWSLDGAPPNSLVAVTFVKEGFFPTLRPIATTTEDVTIAPGDLTVLAPGTWAGVLISVLESPATATGQPGSEVDPSVGHVAFLTSTAGTEPTEAATVTLEPASPPKTGDAPLFVGLEPASPPKTGEAPLFVDANGNLLDATTGTRGLFVNLAPGRYVVGFAGASATCRSDGGLYGQSVAPDVAAGQAGLMVPVVAGFVTLPVAVNCT
jgi:hypothetical protein